MSKSPQLACLWPEDSSKQPLLPSTGVGPTLQVLHPRWLKALIWMSLLTPMSYGIQTNKLTYKLNSLFFDSFFFFLQLQKACEDKLQMLWCLSHFSPREFLHTIATHEHKTKHTCWLHKAIVLQVLLKSKHVSGVNLDNLKVFQLLWCSKSRLGVFSKWSWIVFIQ